MNKDNNILVIAGIATLGMSILYGLYTFRGYLLRHLITKENYKKLQLLHPKYKRNFINFINDLNRKKYNVYITSGFRSFESQNMLHQQNNNAALAGHSLHNYGLALDINILEPDYIGMNTSDSKWLPIVEIAKNNNLDWGGQLFKSYSSGGGDRVHFQPKDLKYKGTDLLTLYNNNKGDSKGFVKI